MSSIISSFPNFAKDIEKKCIEADIDLKNYVIDHVCWRSASETEYQDGLGSLYEASVSYNKDMFRGREFHIFVLQEPLHIAGQEVAILEYPAPKHPPEYNTGRQHIEIIDKTHHDTHNQKRDHIQIKTLETPLTTKILQEGRVFLRT